tara:strand:- start:55091 stop:55579 length:489 start_codon:yes stop_codon:yes gene_type:complete
MSPTVFTHVAHDDHDLTEEQTNYVQTLPRLLDRPEESFILEVVPLPEHLGTVPCGLYGPAAGDAPVEESSVFYMQRGERRGPSRMVRREYRPARNIVVIGIRGGVCFTMYGSRAESSSPREPWDAREMEEYARCVAFWKEHALVADGQEDLAGAYTRNTNVT